MSFGFPAYSTDSHRFNLRREDLARVVCAALENLGWRYDSPLTYRFFARVSTNPWSWGEKLSVEISYDGTVNAKSECMLVTQCFDWGKNRRNVKAFFDQVSRMIPTHDASHLRAPLGERESASGDMPPITVYDERASTPIERVFNEED